LKSLLRTTRRMRAHLRKVSTMSARKTLLIADQLNARRSS